MRNNTQRIYERLSRGEFLSVDSTEASIRHLYEDIEENFDDYADFFKEIGLQLESGNGYFFLVFQFLVPKSLKYLKINSKTVAHVNIYGYIYIC